MIDFLINWYKKYITVSEELKTLSEYMIDFKSSLNPMQLTRVYTGYGL